MLSDLPIHLFLPSYRTKISTILRPAHRPTQVQTRRKLHLVHALFALEDTDILPLKSLKELKYPSATETVLKLIDRESNEVETMTLEQACQRLKPLSYLAEAGSGAYRIQQFPSPERVNRPQNDEKWVRKGRGKEIHLTTSVTSPNLRHNLSLSYNYLLEGSRVEMHLRQKTKRSDGRTVDWALRNCMHLRPDSILAAMPQGTRMLVGPVVSDMSFRTKEHKRGDIFKTKAMWAFEHKEVMKLAGQTAPKWVLKRAREIADT